MVAAAVGSCCKGRWEILRWGDMLCGGGSLRVEALKNRGVWGEAIGGTCGVDVGLPARGTCVFYM